MKAINHIPDAPARKAAIDPAGSFIVQAPAGSGKTGLLIRRYLALLSCVAAPEEIIAITFTRKAAAEMRERIIGALARAKNPDPPGPEHEKTIWDLARAALSADMKSGWHIHDNPSRLRVMTIDSLCASLTRQMPVLSGFGGQPQITENAAALYTEAAANTLAGLESGSAWSDDIAVLVKHTDNRLDLVASLVAAMLPRRDQWLRHVVETEDSGAFRAALESAMCRAVTDTLSGARAAITAPGMPSPEHWAPLARFAANTLLSDGAESPICACRAMAGCPDTGLADLPAWQGICELFLTKKGEWRKPGGVNKNIGFPAKRTGDDPETSARNLEMKTAFKAILEEFLKNPSAAAALDGIRLIPAASYTDEQWRVMSALFTVLKLAVAHLRLVFAEKNQVDFTEMAMRAASALETPDGPTDLAMRLDYTISHLLVDEFQDTSISQFELIRQLTAGWTPDDGRTFFAVGDPMQSIYGFREAEVGIFLNTWKHGLGHIPLTPLTLSANFRSEEGIVDWINETFPEVFPETADGARGAVPYTPCTPVHQPGFGPAVHVHAVLDEDAGSEAAAVAACIESIRENRADDRIAILVRGRAHLSEIIPAIRARGLRFSAVDIDPLESRPVIRDLVSLARALAHPADRVAWLAILRAPWCGLLLEDLYVLAGDDHKKTIPELIHDPSRIERLSENGKKRLLTFRDIIDSAMENAGRRSLARMVETTWHRLGGPACAVSGSDMADARACLDLLEQEIGTGTLSDYKQFETALSRLFALPDPLADDRLQIMTIHKAKGLEFESLILPGLEKQTRKEEDRLLFWMERPDVPEDEGLLMAPMGETGGDKDPTYRYIKRLHEKKREFETGRLLYVAATRAKKTLHLFGRIRINEDGALKAPPKDSLLHLLWSAVAPDFTGGPDNRTAANPPPEPETKIAVPEIRRLSGQWVRPAPDPGLKIKRTGTPIVSEADTPGSPLFDWSGVTARRVGTVVHQWLRMICEQGIDTWPPDRIKEMEALIRTDMQRKGVDDNNLDAAVGLAKTALTNTLSDTRGKWILSSHASGACEYALSGVDRDEIVNVVIDRTFVDENGRLWIIDYKTSTHAGAGIEEFLDREQQRYAGPMNRYARLMRAMTGRDVTLGLYYPLLRGWREF